MNAFIYKRGAICLAPTRRGDAKMIFALIDFWHCGRYCWLCGSAREREKKKVLVSSGSGGREKQKKNTRRVFGEVFPLLVVTCVCVLEIKSVCEVQTSVCRINLCHISLPSSYCANLFLSSLLLSLPSLCIQMCVCVCVCVCVQMAAAAEGDRWRHRWL